jgi:drug/metabolite transporter (DMT)-like permease
MSPFPLAGETAALGTALFWSLSTMAWSLAGRRVGSVAVTTLRSALAAVVLAALFRAAYGAWWPAALGSNALVLFALSGALGAGVGDLMLFRSYLIIGPRLGMLILALSPIFAALIAWVTPLREALGIRAVAGIATTVAGVAWVVSARGRDDAWTPSAGGFTLGVLLGLGGTLCVAGGFVLSRMGFAAADDMRGAAIAATYVRVVAATLCCLAALPLFGRIRGTLRAFRDRRAMAIIAAGTVAGPIVGIWLSMLAIHWAPTGVVTALMSTAPILMIPMTWFAYGDRPTVRSLGGTLLAVGGALLLLLCGARG